MVQVEDLKKKLDDVTQQKKALEVKLQLAESKLAEVIAEKSCRKKKETADGAHSGKGQGVDSSSNNASFDQTLGKSEFKLIYIDEVFHKTAQGRQCMYIVVPDAT